jgi:hypothetical protein
VSVDDFKPPTPETKSPAQDILDTLAPTAAKLGMKIARVDSVPGDFAFRITARLLSPAMCTEIDEEVFLVAKRETSSVYDLLWSTLEDLQLRLHDQMRKQMQKNDVRQRGFVLSKEDKSLLHKMYTDAIAHLYSPYVPTEEQHNALEDQRRKYEALVGKLLR